jgi:hypothetical protein
VRVFRRAPEVMCKEKSLGEAVIEDLKATVSGTKLKRFNDARAAMNIISTSVNV